MPHFHIIPTPAVTTTIKGTDDKPQTVEMLTIMFRHSNERKATDQSCMITWLRFLVPNAEWANPSISLVGHPTKVVEQACMVAIVERFAKRLKKGLDDANALVTEMLKTHGEQAVWSEVNKEYIPIKKLEQDGKKWRATVKNGDTVDVLLVVDASDAATAKKIAGQRLLALSQEHPETEKARFISWLSGGETVEEVTAKDAPVVVPLSVLLPRGEAEKTAAAVKALTTPAKAKK